MFMASKAEAKVTTDHEEIQRWAEERGGQPACVKGTGNPGDVGMLRIDFPGFSGEESLQHITWEEWFDKFDERSLALLHQEQTAGGAQSNFNKLISRETAEERQGRSTATRSNRKPVKKTAAKSAGKKSASKTARPSTAKKTAQKTASSKRTLAPAKKAQAKKAAAKRAPSSSGGTSRKASNTARKRASGKSARSR